MNGAVFEHANNSFYHDHIVFADDNVTRMTYSPNVLWFVVAQLSVYFTHTLQDYFTGTKTILHFSHFQESKSEEYGKWTIWLYK